MTKGAPFIRVKRPPSKEELYQLLNDAIKEKSRTKKGWKFERFFENLMQREKDFRLVFKHPRTRLGEVDYVFSHSLHHHYFWKLSPYICVECKNWKENITSTEINHLAALIKEKGPFSCCGVYITSSSYDPSAIEAIKQHRAIDNIVIIPVEGKHLNVLIEQGFSVFIQNLCEEIIFKKMR